MGSSLANDLEIHHEEISDVALYAKSKTNVSEFNTIHFNSSIAIVWELCGVDARSEVTTIYESDVGAGQKLIVLFNPLINSLVFEHVHYSKNNVSRHMINVEVMDLNTIFFLFDEKDKIQIYIDCPSTNRLKLSWTSPLVYKQTDIRLFKNSHGFMNLTSALSSFKCRTVLTVVPGSVIHFTGQLSNVGTVVFSFTKSSTSTSIIYSVNYLSGNFQIASNNGHIYNVQISQQITDGFYVFFTAEGLRFYLNCPHKQNQIGFWSTTMFEDKTQIETSRVYHIGNGASNQIMESYCATNIIINLLSSNNTSCFSTNQIDPIIQMIDKGNAYSSVFLPDEDQDKKIEFLRTLDKFNHDYLISPQHRILIASRVNAPSKFFHRPIHDYIEGFSDGQQNFWIGLDMMHKITNKHKYALRIETENGQFVEEYRLFRVGSHEQNFTLTVGDPAFNIYNSFLHHNGLKFSAFDYGPYKNLAIQLSGGFWFSNSMYYYCLTCESGSDSIDSHFNTYRFSGFEYKASPNVIYYTWATRVFKMYLIP